VSVIYVDVVGSGARVHLASHMECRITDTVVL